MNPDDLADLKRQQIELARIALNDAIPSEYKDYKKEKSQKINNLRNKYDETVLDTLDIVKDSLEGKTKKPLAETLISLIKDDDALLYSANTINKGDVYSSDYDRSHVVPSVINIVDVLPKLKIKIIDDFLKTKKKLIDGKPSLQDIMKINNSLYDGLMGIFDKIVVDVAAMYSQLTIGEVADIAISEKLHPDDNIKLNEVEELNSYIRIKIDKIEDTITKMIRAYDQLGYTDERLARMFGLNVAQVKDRKKKNKNQWVDDMRNRDQEETIAYYQNFYGLTRDEAELLWKYDQQFIDYVEREGLSPEQACYEYSMYIGSFSYGDEGIEWNIMAGVLPTDKLRAKFTEDFNFTDEEFDKLSKGINRSHSPSEEKYYDDETSVIIYDDDFKNNGKYTVIIDGKEMSGADYENNTLDVTHTHVAVAIMVKDDIGVKKQNEIHLPPGLNPNTPDIPYGLNDDYATFRGDISSGSLGQRDARADAEALNIINGYRESNYSKGPLTVINKYNQAIANAEDPNKKRMEILSGEDKDFDGYFDSREELKDYIEGPITDEKDYILKRRGYYDEKEQKQKSNFYTEDDKEAMWGYIEDDLGISDETVD